jgi:hypothetical protein
MSRRRSIRRANHRLIPGVNPKSIQEVRRDSFFVSRTTVGKLHGAIAGLDPAISLRLAADARVKPGHDGETA